MISSRVVILMYAWLGCVITPVFASAIYTYSGNAFDIIGNNNPPSGTNITTNQSVSVIFATPSLLLNLDYKIITPTSFSITDGATTFTEASSLDFLRFTFTTDSQGQITDWQVIADEKFALSSIWYVGEQSHQIVTQYSFGEGNDSSVLSECVSLNSDSSCAYLGTDAGQVNTVGTWTVTTVPIPPALWLFGSGLLGLVGISRRKKAA